MDDDQKSVLAREVADFHHGYAVASWADGHVEFVVALVGKVDNGVAKRVQDVVVRDAELTCGGENLDPHPSKLTCRHLTVKSPLVARGHTMRLAASGELSARRLDAVHAGVHQLVSEGRHATYAHGFRPGTERSVTGSAGTDSRRADQ